MTPDTPDTPDTDLFRRAMSRFATGVTVLTTRIGDLDYAMTASALTSVSLEPMLLLVCVEREGRFHDAVVDAGVWGISVLSTKDRPGADWSGHSRAAASCSARPHPSLPWAADRSGVAGRCPVDVRVPYHRDPSGRRPQHRGRRSRFGNNSRSSRRGSAVLPVDGTRHWREDEHCA